MEINLTHEEILNYGNKRELNQSIYEELVRVLEWSKELSNEDLNSAKEFYKEKDEEFTDAIITGGIVGGVQEHIEENLPKAISMKKNALSGGGEKNVEWLKGFIWESFLISQKPPVSNEISDLLTNWEK